MRKAAYLFAFTYFFVSNQAFAQEPESAGLSVKAWPLPSVRYQHADFTLKSMGRIQADSIWISHSGAGHSDGLEIRRFLAGFDATHKSGFGIKTTFDFANDNMVINDAFLEYEINDVWGIKLGHFKEAFGMERTTSNSDLLFMERSVADTFTPRRDTGGEISYHTDNATAAIGIFTDSFETNSNKEHYAVTARSTYATSLNKSGDLLHIGGAISYREMEQLKLSVPVAPISPVRALKAATLYDVENVKLAGLEAALALGSVLLQSEYIRSYIDREAMDSSAFYGWYAQAGWLITGERHEYSTAKGGVFHKVTPHRPFDVKASGWGAWELAARYDVIGLSDGAIQGGHMHTVTGGINWYLNEAWKVMANVDYISTDEEAATPNDEPVVIGLRLQVLF